MELKDLQETAALAHFDMSEQELRTVFPVFEQMLSFFDTMQDADQDEAIAPYLPAASGGDVTACARTVGSEYFRPDEVPQSGDDLAETMLTNAGERDGRFVVIPNVL
ncbi:MAG: aspartyl/glutamyl-tRNA amidotransferase subunit C [Treponema sp.]|jgi:aspartyl-tRNA(Asn)/glutamyl-tRNA(Gln) amidotransferase subunit C|nr:aspartyl/glutamyl-tRNA amidotransferase subunit C [Treponema sp.]